MELLIALLVDDDGVAVGLCHQPLRPNSRINSIPEVRSVDGGRIIRDTKN